MPIFLRFLSTKLLRLAGQNREKWYDHGPNMTRLERDMDRLVYALYGLTPAEIKLVEELTHR